MQGVFAQEEGLTIEDMQSIIAQKTGDATLIGDGKSIRGEITNRG